MTMQIDTSKDGEWMLSALDSIPRHRCDTCKHRGCSLDDEPCHTCWAETETDSANPNPNWTPRTPNLCPSCGQRGTCRLAQDVLTPACVVTCCPGYGQIGQTMRQVVA